MILGLFGKPGGGKGYEACVYHIMEALKRGRKVITNMPLDVDRWAAIDPLWRDLIELRFEPLSERPRDPRNSGVHRVFGHPDDYVSDWRDSEGRGPFFVVDECANVLPRGKTPRDLVEWYEMHRHTNADVLLMAQTPGRITTDVSELMAVCYFCQKAAAWGSMNHYIRKVKDGVRGDVVNTGVRKYEKKYFGLWKSHTKGVSVEELGASDIVPIWKRWPFVGAAVLLPIAIVLIVMTPAPWKVKTKPPAEHEQAVAKAREAAIAQARAASTPAASRVAAAPASAASSPVKVVSSGAQSLSDRGASGGDPYSGYGLHLYGCVSAQGRSLCMFAVSQNGQVVARLTGDDLRQAGYTIDAKASCFARLTFESVSRQVVCDAPTQGVNMPGPEAKKA